MKPEPNVEDFLVPANDAEKQSVVQAVYSERQRAEGDALVEALTDRERLLIEHAWSAAAAATLGRLKEALHCPTAVTLDASAVRQALSSARSVQTRLYAPMFPGQHHDSRVVDIVRSVDRVLTWEDTRP